MISKGTKIILLLMAVFLIVPTTLFADGGNPAPPAEYKYVPPPYMGNINVEYYAGECISGYSGCVYLSGTLKKVGKEGDQCTFANFLWEAGVQQGVFANHTAIDLQGRQLTIAEGCPGLYEIIAAHSLVYVDNDLFTVDLIVMEIVSVSP